MEKKVVSGKRKTAVARAIVRQGNGKVTINKKPVEYLEMIKKMEVEEPVRIAKETIGEEIGRLDIEVVAAGGGVSGQTEAGRLAIAKALVNYLKKNDAKKAELLRRAYLIYDRNMLVADIRRKETYKPGDSKARSKRQKSYR